MKKALLLASALSAASAICQLARGQEILETPNFHDSRQSGMKLSQPLIMRQSNDREGFTSTLIVDCNPRDPKTRLTNTGANGGSDSYIIGQNGVPIIDSFPPTGVVSTPALKNDVITRLMKELSQRRLDDLSPDNLCRDGRPNVGAAAAIMNSIVGKVTEFDI